MENDKSAREEAQDAAGRKDRASVSGQELMDELGRLGSRFVDLAQAAWASDERKQMEADLRKGLNSVVESLEEGFQRIRESEQTKESLEKAKDVADDITERVGADRQPPQFNGAELHHRCCLRFVAHRSRCRHE